MKYSEHMTAMQQDDASLDAAELVAAYGQGIEELLAAVEGMTQEEVHARPIPGRWSTLEVICHLAGAELYFTDRIERAVALERPLLLGVDGRTYPERLSYQALDLG